MYTYTHTQRPLFPSHTDARNARAHTHTHTHTHTHKVVGPFVWKFIGAQYALPALVMGMFVVFLWLMWREYCHDSADAMSRSKVL